MAPLAQRFSRCQSSFLLISAVLFQLAEILLLMDGQAAFQGYDFFLSQLLVVPALLIFLTQWQLKGKIWPQLCPFLRRSSIFIYCFHGQLVVCFLLLCPEQLDKLAASLSIDIFILRSILVLSITLVVNTLVIMIRAYKRTFSSEERSYKITSS